MTGVEMQELAIIKWRLDKMCARRAYQPFNAREASVYFALMEREAELLGLAG